MNFILTSDRFVAKVVNLFERSADVCLVWSPKRDIFDLKIKATLRLVASKRYDGNRSSKYSRTSQSSMYEQNIEVSELIYVELVSFQESSNKIELVRCKSLDKADDNFNDDEDGISNEKYKSLSGVSFHDYMMDHCDLRNPALVKQQTFTSLLHRNKVVKCLRQRQIKLAVEQKSDLTHVSDNENCFSKKNSHCEPQDKQLANKFSSSNECLRDKDLLKSPVRSISRTSLKRMNSSEYADCKRKSILSPTIDVSSGQDSSDDSSDSTSTSDDSRRRHKRHKKRKKHHHKKDKKHRKKKSKKHHRSKSSSSKKRKHKRSADSTSDSHHSKQNLDDKILKWLNQI